MTGISEKLKAVIGDESVNGWAKRHDLAAQTIHEQIKNDRMPRQAQLTRLASATGIPEEWWRSGSLPPPKASVDYQDEYPLRDRDVSNPFISNESQAKAGDDLVSIPCLNVKASAGYGNHVYEERVVGHFQVSRAWVRNVLNCDPGKVHIIFVDGPSMEPTLEDGELVLIDRRCDKFDNDAVYAIQFDGQLRIKRVQLRWDGTVVIKSDNPKFDPDTLTQEQADRLHVIGKVLPWKFGKYRL